MKCGYSPSIGNLETQDKTSSEGRFRKLAGKVHPNIYEVVSLFKSEQAATEVTLMQVAAGGLPGRKRRKYRKHERRIVTIKEK